MELVIKGKKCGEFKTMCMILSSIVDELELQVRDNELFIQAMDTGHICLFEVSLKKEWFETFTTTKKNEIFGVKMSYLSKIMNCLADSDTIAIRNNKKDKLNFELKGEGIVKCFDLSLMEFDCDALEVPYVDHDLDMEIPTDQFQNLVNELSNFGEVVNLNAREDSFSMTTKYNKFETTMNVNIDIEDFDNYSIVEDTEVSSDFSLFHMQKMVSFAKLSKVVKVHFSSNLPIHFEYSLENDSSINLWLSPRVDDD